MSYFVICLAVAGTMESEGQEDEAGRRAVMRMCGDDGGRVRGRGRAGAETRTCRCGDEEGRPPDKGKRTPR